MKTRLQLHWQLLLLVLFLSGTFTAFGQGRSDQRPVPQAALNHIQKNKKQLELEDEDVAELELASETESPKSGMKHLYIKQLYRGIEVHGAVTNISMSKEGRVLTMGNRLQKQVGKRAKSNQPGLDAAGAVAAAAQHLGIAMKEPLTVQERGNGRNRAVTFSKAGISLEPIPAKLVYQPMEDGSLRLAWEVSIYELDGQNWWNLRLDATTGAVLDKDNMVVHCQFENDGPGGKFLHDDHSHTTASPYVAAPQASIVRVSNAYNVFAMPVESPSHGPRSMVSTSAANQLASPQGWHTETRTRGNNVYAYEDPNNNNSWSTNYSPDGGSELSFDFPIDFNKQPVANRDAAITNLFYWNNVVHDVWYQYGFDEASGNFQLNNYGRGGSQGDPVLAEAQDNRNGTSRNNANFATNVDGIAPRMQMYLWSSPPDADMVSVTSPSSVAGSYPATEAAWARKLNSDPVVGKLVVGQGTVGLPQEGCGALTNTTAVAGNIAVAYRGNCPFTEKVEAAQLAGAIAVIVINNAPGDPIAMGGTPTMPITIPAVMISQEAGALLRARMDAGEEVIVRLKDDGRPELDGDFDNGIIVHEYGHGISNRLTGGRTVANCLNNAEQMGEGWSDWFGLMMTMKPGDTGAKVRGIGTYAKGQPTDGPGIRPAPYSTDFGVNPHTYASTNNAAISQPHGVGFVWSTMLWDMTWALIDKYGFDADLYNGKGGNNMAMQLVIDGLKLQACRPGFVDGRDAILLADRQNYEGANQELIWKVFARRGLGFSADQGSNLNRFDQVEAFDLPETYACTTPLTLDAVATSDVYTGGVASNLYLGYGPQNVRLQAGGDADNEYTWSGAEGLSATTGASVIFTPKAAGTYTFTVRAVNGDGCIKHQSITITVVDVRCGDGKKKDKVLVCVDGVAECVAPNAVPYLLTAAKGSLGDCGLAATATATAKAEISAEKMSLRAVPNPFGAKTDIGFTLTQDGSYKLEVLDMRGSVVTVLAQGNGRAGEHKTYQFEKGKLAGGMYIARLVTDEGVSFIRIVMQK
ncbi:T9SS-dependent M36 family metallopeptidase [Pontibacter lucknowensis]|uniref:Por secretion system C-terminal sorting domain-containing protein n=1 Tax=Pontibacter lucknowensis TaxID=1077936 RepID=A0A1N7A852_9BACT|nr:T9SS-dependent M36 family metallopeptidase [Pontibacter lucknowensis]SIR35272.1 Por secretion system C-terminal sorting domain-containing protein [Pontibacter lucknowensis]